MNRGVWVAAFSAAFFSVSAQAEQVGDELLQKGLAGRVTPLDDGVAIQRAGPYPDAGYFLVKLIDKRSTEAAVCPKTAFERGQGKRWRNLNSQIYDGVFDRKGLWGINAGFAVSNPLGQAMRQEVRLVSVKNPHKKSCVPEVLGVNSDGTPPRFLFITPINVNDHVYGTDMVVDLKSVHQMEASQERINQLWAGLGFFAKTISAPLAPLVEAFAGEGKKEVNAALTEVGGEARTTRIFKANPDGNKTQSEFLYLGFENFGQKDPNALSGGVVLQGDYRASVLVPAARYLSEVSQPIPQSVLAATPLSANGQAQTIRERLGAKADGLFTQSTPDGFSGSCTGIRPDLLALGLSEVDADLWLWAMAKASSHDGVSKHLDKIACFGPVAQANLKRVGNITIEPPPPPKVELISPAYPDMHRAMDNLGLMAAQGSINGDLLGRFAEKIDVSIVDDTLPTSLSGGGRDRAAVLGFMVENFRRYGCYLPRTDPTHYQLRPFMPLREQGRAGAMMMHSKDGVPYIVTLGFDGVAKNQANAKAVVSAIAIQKQGGDTGQLVRDLAAGTSDMCPTLPAR